MLFFSLFVFPVLMFLTMGMINAPAATLKFTGMFRMVCATLLGGLWGLICLIDALSR